MNKARQLLFTWTGPIACLMFFIGICPFAHLLPPPISPLTPPSELVAFYSNNRIGILLGEILVLWAAAIMMPFFSVLYVQIRRIEDGFPLMASVLLGAGILIIVEIILPAWLYSTIAFRQSHSEEMTVALSDLAWIMFIWTNPVTALVFASTGYPILCDKSPDPLFPRWVGFVNLGLAVGCIPSTFMTLFYSGPLAWNGLISFWLIAFEFGFWFFLMFYALRRAIRRDYTAITGT